jgi:hypothetical protein
MKENRRENVLRLPAGISPGEESTVTKEKRSRFGTRRFTRTLPAGSPLRAALPLLALAGSLLLALAGCVTAHPAPAAGARAVDSLWADYEHAVEDARYPQPDHISRDLVPITTFFDGLVWDETRQKVLMVNWTYASRYNPGPTTLSRATWLTAAPFLRRFCQASGLRGQALEIRLSQRLGTPPDTTYDSFVEMWVDPADFFRPCPDPEINDRECQVNLTAGSVDRGSSCPWSAAREHQLSGKFATVLEAHLDWMCSNWASSYPPGKPRRSYPWTALGYTYDWIPSSRDHVGESEFVAPQGTTVVVRRVIPTAEYCAPQAAREPRP